MWLVPYTLEAHPVLSISLPEDEQLFGLQIWNYNKSVDDSFRGVKEMRISIDNKWVESATAIEEENIRKGCVIVRKAPGNTELEFDQTILFLAFKNSLTALQARYMKLSEKAIEPGCILTRAQ